MGGKSSRAKGGRGEREVAKILSTHGYHVERRGAGFDGDDLRIKEFPEWYSEVRRRETLCIPEWCREIKEKANGDIPILFFRRNREPWRVVLELEDFLRLLE